MTASAIHYVDQPRLPSVGDEDAHSFNAEQAKKEWMPLSRADQLDVDDESQAGSVT